MNFASALAAKPKAAPLELGRSWTLWYLIRANRAAVQATNYETALHSVATFRTAEDFWAIFGHVRHPSDLPLNADYQLFVEGVKPVWEHPANAQGGKWILRLRKGLSNRLWEHLVCQLTTLCYDYDTNQ